MKKLIVFVSFFVGAVCFITAGLYINKKNAGMTDEYVQEEVSKVKAPELLSEINMSAYVSLPASFSDIDIIENIDNIDVTEDNVDNIMYEKLFSTAKHLATLDGDDKLIIADYTVTQGTEVKDVRSNVRIGYKGDSLLYNDAMHEALKDAAVGMPVHAEHVMFDNMEDVTVDMTITDIYDMPYPVTDSYVSQATGYESIFAMRTAMLNDSSGEAKKLARDYTISTLIDTMIDQTTFIQLPESLIMKELEALQKKEPTETYENAKKSLYKIFFIASMMKNYDIATKTDMEKRFNALDADITDDMTPYEVEREKYLLFEEDVVTCLYKRIVIDNE